ncbi:hypothetical protein P280DRAFT_535264 [Massarina eburnea CBS 473.64]|uniref:Uncharacterized protein n=1 Tax=Massarina eburnea CBS 473.64 TaxID=1395130 RepID=A0A6A6SA89_9PLEO|nr:hypothetical protein P280DRAFT_535264 [Massarina eburnea CBS 473.64]
MDRQYQQTSETSRVLRVMNPDPPSPPLQERDTVPQITADRATKQKPVPNVLKIHKPPCYKYSPGTETVLREAETRTLKPQAEDRTRITGICAHTALSSHPPSAPQDQDRRRSLTQRASDETGNGGYCDCQPAAVDSEYIQSDASMYPHPLAPKPTYQAYRPLPQIQSSNYQAYSPPSPSPSPPPQAAPPSIIISLFCVSDNEQHQQCSRNRQARVVDGKLFVPETNRYAARDYATYG